MQKLSMVATINDESNRGDELPQPGRGHTQIVSPHVAIGGSSGLLQDGMTLKGDGREQSLR